MILKLLMFAIGTFLLSAQPPPKDDNPTAHKGSAKAQQSETKIPTPGVEQGQSRPKNRSTEESAEKVDTDRQIARYTCVLAVVGALQFLVLICHGWIFHRSLKETKTATELTRQSIILTQRPKLVVRNVVINDPQRLVDCGAEPSADPLSGAIRILNIGTTVARVTALRCSAIVRIADDLLPMGGLIRSDGSKLLNEVFLPAGGCTTYNFSETIPVPSAELQRINDRSLGVFIIGWAIYKDDLNNVRTTRFCRKWSPDRRRFEAVDDPDYENID
jgi:hypothetical protein